MVCLVIIGDNMYSFIVEKVGVTYDKHKKYKILIDKILSGFYPDRIFYEGMPWVRKQKFDEGEGDISIINKAIGNLTIIGWLFRTFKFETFSHLIDFVRKNKRELFHYDGKYFKEVLAILINTAKKGDKNEELAMKYIINLLDIKCIKSEIKQTSVCSREDVIDGIDLILTAQNREWYIQVKPLTSFILNGNYYKIKGSGKIKLYKKIHYYIFVNDKEYLFFSNLGIKIKNGDLYIPSKNLNN